MLLYTLYNADLLDLPDNQEAKDAISYIDDIALIAVGDNLTESTNRLKNLMTKAGRGLEWSVKHNSRFKVNKSAIQHFTRKAIQDPENISRCIQIPNLELKLEGQVVKQVQAYKYLGIVIDSQLNWKEQAQ